MTNNTAILLIIITGILLVVMISYPNKWDFKPLMHYLNWNVHQVTEFDRFPFVYKFGMRIMMILGFGIFIYNILIFYRSEKILIEILEDSFLFSPEKKIAIEQLSILGVSLGIGIHFVYISIYNISRVPLWEEIILVLFYVVGIIGCYAWNFLTFLMVVECLGLVNLFLIYNNRDIYTTWGAWALAKAGRIDFLFFSVIASLFLILGILLVGVASGDAVLEFSKIGEIHEALILHPLLYYSGRLGYTLILYSIFFKVGVHPFWWWPAYLYSIVSDRLLFFLLVPSKLVFFSIMLPKLVPLAAYWDILEEQFCVAGTISAIIGTLISLQARDNFKLLLAGSSASQAGLILFLFSYGNFFVTFIYILFIYSGYAGMLFSYRCFIPYYTENQEEGYNLGTTDVETFQNTVPILEQYRYPIILYFFIFLVIFGGFPPFIVFLSKIMYIFNIINTNVSIYYILIFFINILTMLYVLRYLLYFYKPEYRMYDDKSGNIYVFYPTIAQLFFLLLLGAIFLLSGLAITKLLTVYEPLKK